MIKKIAICAILVLVLVPAFAMAAGPQGQGAGNAQVNSQQALQQGQSIGAGEREQARLCSENCEMAREMIRNQDQILSGSAGDSAPSITAASQQHRFGGTAGTQAMDRVMNRTHLRDGSCGNCQNL